MNRPIAALLGLAVLSATVRAAADPCATIRDHDTRQECRAAHYRDPSHCHLIRDHDRRVLCQARWDR